MIIRKAEPGDAPLISSCVDEAFSDYIPLIGKRPAPMLLDYDEVLRNNFAFVAVSEAGLDGAATIVDGDGDFMWLDVLAVRKNLKGRGIGKALLARTEEFIKEKGKSECRIYTNVRFESAIAFYLRLGYTEYQRATEDGYDRVFLRKKSVI